MSPSVIDDTLGVMLKYREDVQAVRGEQTRALVNRALNRGTRRGGGVASSEVGHLLDNLLLFGRLLRRLALTFTPVGCWTP